MKTDIKSLPLDSIFNIVKNMGQPSFRAKQIFTWLHKFGVDSFDEMSNLPKAMREKLAEDYYISSCKIEKSLFQRKTEPLNIFSRFVTANMSNPLL